MEHVDTATLAQPQGLREVARSNADRLARVICLGNEKGGSGKSTTAMHIVVALLKMGKRVGVIDLDARQRSLARYIENRREWAKRRNVDLQLPETRVVEPSGLENRAEARRDEDRRFRAGFDEL